MGKNNNKIHYEFGGGETTLLLSLRNKEIFDPEIDQNFLEKKGYFVSPYYSSRSRLSGAGWISPANDLVKVGYYRTDIYNIEQRGELIFPETGNNIKIYVPWKSHQGIDHTMPIVLSDGHSIALFDVDDVGLALRLTTKNWEDPSFWNTRNFEFWSVLNGTKPERKEMKYQFISYYRGSKNPFGREKIARFLNLEEEVCSWKQIEFIKENEEKEHGFLLNLFKLSRSESDPDHAYWFGSLSVPTRVYPVMSMYKQEFSSSGWCWYTNPSERRIPQLLGRKTWENRMEVICYHLLEDGSVQWTETIVFMFEFFDHTVEEWVQRLSSYWEEDKRRCIQVSTPFRE